MNPVDLVDGYPRLEDLGDRGHGPPLALVCRDGTVFWLCVSCFDAPPVFASPLDARRGGAFRLTLAGATAFRQRYEADIGVLVTEMRARVRRCDASQGRPNWSRQA